MLLSIIVPAYNVENQIDICLQSLENQFVDGGYEIIVVNDGSSDGTIAKLQKWKSMYNNIVVIDQKNKGVSAARNRGIQAARGKWIAFCDSDDFWTGNTIGNILDFVEEKDYDYGLVNYNMVWNGIKEITYNCRFDGSNTDFFQDFPFWAVWMFLYRRDIILDNNLLFREDVTLAEDTLFNAEYLLSGTFRVISFDTRIYNYVENGCSITHSFSPEKAKQKLDNYLPIFGYYNSLAEAKGLKGTMLDRLRYLSLKALPIAVGWILNSKLSYQQICSYCEQLLTLNAVYYDIPIDKSVRFYQLLISHPRMMFFAHLMRRTVLFDKLLYKYKQWQNAK